MNNPPKLVMNIAVAIAGGTFIYKYVKHSQTTSYSGTEQLVGKTVIVTGATKGIGRESAYEMARRGARVIMASRDMTNCEAVRQSFYDKGKLAGKVECMQCDLASVASIREFAAKINKEEERVDVLLNNAGVVTENRTLSKDYIELQLAVNYMAPFLLSNLLLDKLKENRGARIVNVLCTGYRTLALKYEDLNSETSFTPIFAYNRSKMALGMFTLSLAELTKDSGIDVLAVVPDTCKTDLGKVMLKEISYGAYLMAPLTKTAIYSSKTVVKACISDEFIGKNGNLVLRLVSQDDWKNSMCKDNASYKRLWTTSERWTGLDNSWKREADLKNE